MFDHFINLVDILYEADEEKALNGNLNIANHSDLRKMKPDKI